MSEQAHPFERPGEARPSAPDPLWLPRGSVRAVIAIGMIGVWAALETGIVGIPASDAVRSMAVAVAAGYGVLRSREQRGEQASRTDAADRTERTERTGGGA